MRNQVDSGGVYVNDFLHHIVNGLPKLLGALLLLFIGYLIAKAISSIVRRALFKARLNEHLHSGQGGNIIQRAIPNPARFVASAVYWVIFLFALSIAVSALGIPALVEFVRGVYAYIPNVIAAVLIFLVAGAISAGIAGLVTRTMGDTPTGKVVAAAGPVVVMGLAAFMILNQLKIAPAIVTITYAAIVGSAALGMALAFGLGGREVAGQLLQGLYEKGQQNKGAVAADFRKGGREAKRKGDDLRAQM
jgi:small-conductance mechanosensitive channel